MVCPDLFIAFIELGGEI